jgi:UrcA family protein
MKWNKKAALSWTARFTAFVMASSIVMPAAHAARPRTEYAIAVVQYDDLELTEQRDVARLLMRVKRAARHVCTPKGVAGQFSLKTRRECYKATLRKAMKDMERIADLPDQPTLARDSG